MGFYVTNIFYTDREREREREREKNMFWLFGSRFVRQAEKCLVLFSSSKEYLES